jgi:hypothetical protein
MEMPKPGDEQKKLAALFAGVWQGEAKLHPSAWDPKGGTAFDTWVVRPSLDGFFLLIDYTEERDGKIVYRGHGVHGWDTKEKAYLVYWFDNLGGIPKAPNKGTLDGSRYTYTSFEGSVGKSRFTYAWDGDRFEFSIEASPDGGATWRPVHEGKYRRA